jgi:FkbM family methyltransferase
MEKYTFKSENQSPWLVDIYNQFLPYKTDGFLVEIGVGHTIKGIDRELPSNLINFQRCSSNTADLLDLGWSGIYIEPVKEYCDEAKISHKDNLDRLQIINLGASNKEDELELFLGDSFVSNNHGSQGYSWIGRKVNTDKTSNILEKHNCPKNIDIMSIDVEGFELEVIQGIDFLKHLPSMLVIEIDKVSPNTINYMLPSSYKQVAKDNINGVWILN